MLVPHGGFVQFPPGPPVQGPPGGVGVGAVPSQQMQPPPQPVPVPTPNVVTAAPPFGMQPQPGMPSAPLSGGIPPSNIAAGMGPASGATTGGPIPPGTPPVGGVGSSSV